MILIPKREKEQNPGLWQWNLIYNMTKSVKIGFGSLIWIRVDEKYELKTSLKLEHETEK